MIDLVGLMCRRVAIGFDWRFRMYRTVGIGLDCNWFDARKSLTII